MRILLIYKKLQFQSSDVQFSGNYFYMNTNIWEGFQICISVPINVIKRSEKRQKDFMETMETIIKQQQVQESRERMADRKLLLEFGKMLFSNKYVNITILKNILLNVIKGHCQILFLILSNFEEINWRLFTQKSSETQFSDNFRGNVRGNEFCVYFFR